MGGILSQRKQASMKNENISLFQSGESLFRHPSLSFHYLLFIYNLFSFHSLPSFWVELLIKKVEHKNRAEKIMVL